MNKALPLAITVASVLMTAAGADKQVMLIASKPSHPPGQHEHNADVLLLAKWLSGTPGLQATTALNGEWPADTAFEKADAVFMYCDGSDGHLAFQDDRAKTISQAVARGAGLMFYHYATEPPAKRGHQEMLDWIGGYFDLNYSVNPIFDASFNALPNHPITRGVKPFHIRDEWYYNLRFRDNTRGL